MRSRVMPGSFVTIDRRVPVRRLNSVDLPTLGRPTMTMDGSFVFIRVSIRRGEAADFSFGFTRANSRVPRRNANVPEPCSLGWKPESVSLRLHLHLHGFSNPKLGL